MYTYLNVWKQMTITLLLLIYLKPFNCVQKMSSGSFKIIVNKTFW